MYKQNQMYIAHYYDSKYYTNNVDEFKNIQRFFSCNHKVEISDTVRQVAQEDNIRQTNGHDCGIYLLSYLKQILQFHDKYLVGLIVNSDSLITRKIIKDLLTHESCINSGKSNIQDSNDTTKKILRLPLKMMIWIS